MTAPQVVAVVRLALRVVVSLAGHGRPVHGRLTARNHLVGVIVWTLLLLWGGFFR